MDEEFQTFSLKGKLKSKLVDRTQRDDDDDNTFYGKRRNHVLRLCSVVMTGLSSLEDIKQIHFFKRVAHCV